MLVLLSIQNVEACGEIKELKSSIGTISSINETNYLITVPEGTTELTLEGTTDYAWVQNYGPRKVSTTNGKIRLEVDGASCGEGITTYFVDFKFLSNLIAENDPIVPDVQAPDNQAPGSNTDPEVGSQEPNYGVLPLTRLNISEIDFEFDPSKRIYDLAVDGTVKKLNIDAGTEDPVVNIKISDNVNDLKEGINVIQITLTDPYGNTGLYVLNIEKTKVKSSNNYLGSLVVDKYQLNFDPSITNYTLSIGKESTLNITPTTESELAQVVVLGNSNLSNGSVITVRVTAEDGSTKDYTINITRSFNIMDYWIYVVLILLILLIIIIFILMKQKKNKKNMGPQTIAGEANTAGVVQEIAPQNQSAGTNEGVIDQNNVQVSSSTPGTIKIIEPTNLDTPVQPETTVNEDQSPTEVFQL